MREFVLEVNCIGDINAGASNVVLFSPRKQPITVIVPAEFINETRQLIVLRVVGNSLAHDRIENGDFLLFRTKFELSEVKNQICAVYIISRNEYFAKHLSIDPLRQTVTLYSGNCESTEYSFDDVEIKGICIGFQVNF